MGWTYFLFLFFIDFVIAGFFDHGERPVFFEYQIDYNDPGKVLREFEEFIVKYKRNYKTPEEKHFRFNAFSKNHNKISKINQAAKRAGDQAKYGINKFGDWTHDEFVGTTSRIAPKNYSDISTFKLFHHSNSSRQKRFNSGAPASFDLRNFKVRGRYVIGPVKNQGHCGCCWAFAATAVTEAAYKIQAGKNVPLSDQELCDCATTSETPGCVGGDYIDGIKFVHYFGQSAEMDYPYEDGRSNHSNMCAYKNVDRRIDKNDLRFFRMSPYRVEEDIMENLYFVNTPVAVSFRIGKGFQFYQSDVLTLQDCDQMKPTVWHSAAIVGYGSTRNRLGRRVDYWILKNSWDSDWGESGYVKVVRGVNWCNIEDHAVSADLRPPSYYNQFG